MSIVEPPEYYLEVLKEGEEPRWPHPEEELIVGSQPLSSGYIQYWAYPKESGKDPDDLPHAEVMATENSAHKAVILIDELQSPTGKSYLELVLVKDGHAWARTESSAANLEDNLNSVLEVAHNKFNLNVEHFATTGRVSEDIERRLDELDGEGADNFSSEEQTAIGPVVQDESVNIRPVVPRKEGVIGYQGSDRPPSKLPALIIISIAGLLIISVFVGIVFFKDQVKENIFNKITGASKSKVAEVTPTPTNTPTPTPTLAPVERSKYKVRVLNGTIKTGAAGTLAKSLKGLGWQILTTGNAKDQETTTTQVRVKEDAVASLSATLVKDLSPDLKAETTSDLKSTDKADVEVVIGKE